MSFSMFAPKIPVVSNAILSDADREEQRRVQAINKRWLRYNGQYDKPLRPTLTDPRGADNTTINLARRTVDISAFYLFGKELGFEVDTGASAADNAGAGNDKPEEAWLEACWQAQTDGKTPFLLEFATGAGVAGDGYLRVLLPNKDDGEIYPRIVALDAVNVKVFSDPTDYTKVIEYRLQWNGIDPVTRRAAVFRHIIYRVGARWYTEEQISRGDSRTFQTVKDTTWPYSWCPIFHVKNRPMPHSFYGTSDTEDDVLRINDAMNFTVSNINRILRVHGHPQQYITGQKLDQIDRGIGAMPYFPNEHAKINIVEMLSDLTSSFTQLEKLRDAYHELTSIPEVVSGKLESVGQLSGLALQILYGPLIALTTVKRGFVRHDGCAALSVPAGNGRFP